MYLPSSKRRKRAIEKEKSRVPKRMQNQDLVAMKIEKGCRIYKKVTIVMVSYEHRSIESRKVTTYM